MTLEIIPVCFDYNVDTTTDVASIIAEKIQLHNGDIIVVSQKIISKQEGRVVSLDSVTPSLLAQGIASQYQKDPRIVELILSESGRIVRMGHGVIVVRTHHGFVCANAGIDESNVALGSATLLPVNPDASARELMHQLYTKTGTSVAIIISDTFGRPFRTGQTDCALGISGIKPIADYRQTTDSAGRRLRVSEIAIADEICAAAELVKGKSRNCPISVVRNFKFASSNDSVNSLLRFEDEDLFL